MLDVAKYFKNRISSYMTDQKVAGLEKSAALGVHRELLPRYCLDFSEKKKQPCGKGPIKGIAFPRQLVVDGFKIAPIKFGETGMRERKQNCKTDLRTMSGKEF